MSLLDLLVDHPFADGDVLVHTVDEAITKGQLLARVEALASQVSVRPGQSVAVVADGLDALIGMFAAWRCDAVFVPVNPRLPDGALREVLHDAGAAAVVRDGRPMDAMANAAVTKIASAAFVTWTSGTTGKPKPILHTHDAYLELIDRVLAPLSQPSGPRQPSDGTKPPSPNLIPVSMALNAGIYNALFGLRAGAPLVLMDRFTTVDFATLVDRHQIRSTVLPPAAIAMLNDDPDIASLAPLRYVRSITAPLSPFQARRFTDRFGAFVLNSYGQAEIGEVIGWTAADAKAHPEKIGAIGKPHPGVDVRLEGVDGSGLDSNGVGVLMVRPPNHAAELDDRVSDDGFVRTGDLARIDADGFVWIEGRESDLINRGGNKVFPDEVEEVLASVSGVREVAVVGRPDDRLGEVPVAFVVEGDGSVDDADLEAAARANLVPYKVPVEYVRVPELPRSEVGKVLRRELTTNFTSDLSSDTEASR